MTRLSFDGKGINGPDEFRSRIATFTSDEAAKQYGKLFEAAPELLSQLERIEARLTACARAFYVGGKAKDLRAAFDGWKDDIEPARAAIAKAT